MANGLKNQKIGFKKSLAGVDVIESLHLIKHSIQQLIYKENEAITEDGSKNIDTINVTRTTHIILNLQQGGLVLKVNEYLV